MPDRCLVRVRAHRLRPDLEYPFPRSDAVPEEQLSIVELLLIYVVIIGAVMIFMTSRGRKKQQAQQLMMRDALAVGVEARTIGGLVGEVVELTDEHVVLETTPGVKLKFVKTAIAGVVPPETEDEDSEDGDEDETDEAVAELDTDVEDGTDSGTETDDVSGDAAVSDKFGVHDSVVAEAEKVVEAAASTESTKK